MSKTVWTDKNVQYPHRYQLDLVSGNVYDLTAVPGTITDPGTPVNAVNMNNIENRLASLAKILALGGLPYI